MLKYTSKFKQECKRSKLDGNHRAIADLIIMGWSPKDAYIAVGLYNAALSDDYHENMIKEITGTLDFNEYLHKRERKLESQMKGIKDGGDSEQQEGSEDTKGKYRSKDEVLDGLVAELPYLRGKDRADVLMKIADLQQLKKEETIEEDNTIHFYLPIKCHDCDLYRREKKRLEKLRKKEEEEED